MAFRYTLDSPYWRWEDRNSYERNGFLLVRGLIPDADIDKYQRRFQEICAGTFKVEGITIMRDVAIAKSEFVPGEKAVTKIQDFYNDEQMFDYCRHPNIVRYLEGIIGPNINAIHTMLINKPPDPGTLSSRHPMHQDLHYFPHRPADRIACSWTAMEWIHRGNGCLVVVPGSHKTGKLLPHTYPKWEGGVNKMYHGIQDYDPSQPRTHVEMYRGDTLFFHPLLIHGSGTNRTQGFRKAISGHYASTDCELIDVTGTVQQNIADEVDGIVKKRYGDNVKVDYRDVWRMKSRVVKGHDAKL